MEVLRSKGLFRREIGLNCIASVQNLAELLGLKNGFRSPIFHEMEIEDFVKTTSRLPNNFFKHSPIIIVKGHENSKPEFLHAVVLLSEEKGKLIVKNSLKGSIVFGKKQLSQHEVEFTTENPSNKWNLACPLCWFIELN